MFLYLYRSTMFLAQSTIKLFTVLTWHNTVYILRLKNNLKKISFFYDLLQYIERKSLFPWCFKTCLACFIRQICTKNSSNLYKELLHKYTHVRLILYLPYLQEMKALPFISYSMFVHLHINFSRNPIWKLGMNVAKFKINCIISKYAFHNSNPVMCRYPIQ